MIDQNRTLMETWGAEVPVDHRAASELRSRIAAHLATHGVAETVIADIVLVVAELVTNAIEQAPTRPIGVSLDVTSSDIRLQVRNEITGEHLSPPESWIAGEVTAGSGRGLLIVARLADTVEVGERAGWSEVRCRFVRQPVS